MRVVTHHACRMFSPQVLIRNAEVKSARFSHGIYCKFKPYINSTDAVESPTIKGTLSPEFNFAEIHSIPSITQEDLDWFDSGCISFELYGKQVDSVPDASLLKMTTKVGCVGLWRGKGRGRPGFHWP